MRDLHKDAFKILQEFVEILKNEKKIFLNDLHRRYFSIFLDNTHEFSEKDFKNFNYTNLQEKLKKYHNNTIQIISAEQYNRKKIVFKNGINIADCIYKSAVQQNLNCMQLQNVAYELRQSIKNISKTGTNDVTTQTIISGDCEIPEILFEFICDLVQRPDTRRKESTEDLVKIKSLCNDIIFIVSRGR